MENITFGEKGIINLRYKSIKQFRDFILDGTEIFVIERKVIIKNYHEERVFMWCDCEAFLSGLVYFSLIF